jgi:hypothetical protein
MACCPNHDQSGVMIAAGSILVQCNAATGAIE